ncbi:PRD domain-containing protein [Amphibacillus marinus]|uniref:PRD domain-containing protein n=1 Tax=Amphibacillus marinus TaxID=872970 RepID=A0A1H8L9Z4_9BACI|nr:PRD domain-containing protein [Amphibacillus marinus]SEO01933.1 PRD domain-containing protein [Amphibacillus marinus]
MKETRLKKILDKLSETSGFITSTELANHFNLSKKTISRDIRELNTLLNKNGAKINAKPSLGNKFEVTDSKLFEEFIRTEWYKHAFEHDDRNNPQYRREYILSELLINKVYVKAEDFMDQLVISRSTFNMDLTRAKDFLTKFQLEIKSRPHYGLYVEGEETNFRKAILKLLNHSLADQQTEGVMEDIKGVLYSEIKKHNYVTTLYSLNDLVSHVYVSVLRINKGLELRSDHTSFDKSIANSSEFHVAVAIAQRLERHLSISMNMNEKLNLTMLLISRITPLNSHDAYIIPNNINDLLERIVAAIDEEFNISLQNDLDFRISLGLHLKNMGNRLKYNLILKNPILEQVKSDILPFQIATFISSLIGCEFTTEITEDEIGYIALHINSALIKKDKLKKKKDILIVCATGKSTAILLKNKFENEFLAYINTLQTLDALELERIDLTKFDLIATTVKLNITTNVPIIEISTFLSGNDVESIRNRLKSKEEINYLKTFFSKDLFFVHPEGQTATEILDYLSGEIANKFAVSKQHYFEELMKREALSSTAFDNLIAIPHPLNKVVDDSFVAVALLREPIKWGQKMVSIVLLMNVDPTKGNKSDFLYQTITDLLSDRLKISFVQKAQSYDDFVSKLV